MTQQNKITKIENLTSALSLATEATDNAMKAEQELNSRVEELSLSIDNFTQKRKLAEAAEAQAIAQLEQARETIKKATVETRTIEQDLAKTRKLLDQKTREREALETEENRLRREKETEVTRTKELLAEAAAATHQAKTAEDNALEEVEEAEAKLQDIKQQIKENETIVAAATQQLEQVKQTIKQATKENRTSEQELAKTSKSLDQLRKKREQLEAKESQLRAKIEQKPTLSKTIKEHEASFASTLKAFEAAKTAENNTQAALESTKVKIENINQQITRAQVIETESKQKAIEAKNNIYQLTAETKLATVTLEKAQNNLERASKHFQKINTEEQEIINSNDPKHFHETPQEKRCEPICESASSKTFTGMVKLLITSTPNQEQIKGFISFLDQIDNLQVKFIGGSDIEGIQIVTLIKEPVPLLRILQEFEQVQSVKERSSSITINFKATAI